MPAAPDKINLAAKLATFDETWVPKIVAELNGQLVKVAKFEGEYPWHQHADEDELFLVLRGQIEIRLRGRSVTLGEGECMVVPRGVEHSPRAEALAEVLLFEPAATRSTGDLDHAHTIEAETLERI